MITCCRLRLIGASCQHCFRIRSETPSHQSTAWQACQARRGQCELEPVPGRMGWARRRAEGGGQELRTQFGGRPEVLLSCQCTQHCIPGPVKRGVLDRSAGLECWHVTGRDRNAET